MFIETRQAVECCPRAADLPARGKKCDAREEKEEVTMSERVVANDAAEISLYL